MFLFLPSVLCCIPDSVKAAVALNFPTPAPLGRRLSSTMAQESSSESFPHHFLLNACGVISYHISESLVVFGCYQSHPLPLRSNRCADISLFSLAAIKVGFIGGGKMAKAMAVALVRARVCSAEDICMSARTEASCQAISALGYSTRTNEEASLRVICNYMCTCLCVDTLRF